MNLRKFQTSRTHQMQHNLNHETLGYFIRDESVPTRTSSCPIAFNNKVPLKRKLSNLCHVPCCPHPGTPKKNPWP
jgi:hypothetical protein